MYLNLQEYFRPASFADCLRLAAPARSALLAGGTWLNVGGHEAIERLIDLQALPLTGIAREPDSLRLGALVTLAELAAADLPTRLAALGEAARAEKNGATRNRSTLGGRLCRDRSDGRLATAFVALGAEVRLLQFEGDAQRDRQVWLEAHLKGIAAGLRGLLTDVTAPLGDGFSGYESFGLTAMDAPYADAAILWADGHFRVASGGHGPNAAGTLRLTGAERALVGITPVTPTAEWKPALRQAILAEVPGWSDDRASGDYRRELAVALVSRLVERWQARA